MDKKNCDVVWKRLLCKKRGYKTLYNRNCLLKVVMRAILIKRVQFQSLMINIVF